MATPTRTAVPVRPKVPARPSGGEPAARRIPPVKSLAAGKSGPARPDPSPAAPPAKPEPKILFQKYFKSVGPRTYAAQVKELLNGNHLLVLTEGKRDEQTGELRKTRLFIYGEDFTPFFRLLHETAAFIRANPIPEEVRQRREKFWSRKARNGRAE